jgi:hypothetical protein
MGIPMNDFKIPNDITELMKMWSDLREELNKIRSAIGSTVGRISSPLDHEAESPIEKLDAFLKEHKGETGRSLAEAFLALKFDVPHELVRQSILRDLEPMSERLIAWLLLTTMTKSDVADLYSGEKFRPLDHEEDIAKNLAAEPAVQLGLLYFSTGKIYKRAKNLVNDLAAQNDAHASAQIELDGMERHLETLTLKVAVWEEAATKIVGPISIPITGIKPSIMGAYFLKSAFGD